MSDSDSSDGELPLLAAEPPKKRQKPDAAAAAVAAAWRGDDRPLEKPAKPQARAAPKPKPAAPKPSTAAPPPDAPKTVHVSGLPKSATAPLLRQHCVESLDEDESAIVDCRLPPPKKTPPGGGRAPPRFAFVECRDPKAAARLVHALDEAKWLGAQLTVNFARPKGRPRAEERKEAHEMIQAHARGPRGMVLAVAAARRPRQLNEAYELHFNRYSRKGRQAPRAKVKLSCWRSGSWLFDRRRDQKPVAAECPAVRGSTFDRCFVSRLASISKFESFWTSCRSHIPSTL